jgi:hypothetical protein
VDPLRRKLLRAPDIVDEDVVLLEQRQSNEGILVPNTLFALALPSSAASSGIGFINWTPRLSPAGPLSTFKNSTTRFTFHR